MSQKHFRTLILLYVALVAASAIAAFLPILALSYYSGVSGSFSANNALQATREDARA
jgi:hypothetical protein